MDEARVRVKRTAFEQTLKSRGVTQALLAEKIGANPKSFSRWINEGFLYSKFLWDLTDALDLSEDELSQVIVKPNYEVFFRKKFLGNVPEGIHARAKELAKALFGLTYLHSDARFCPPNISKIDDVQEVATQIRKHTGINSFNNLLSIVSRLASQGIEVAVIPFSQFGVSSDDKYEKAFSVTDGQRYAIFLDSSCTEATLLFNLCHELSHLFRPDIEFSKTEESFCSQVAEELVYPKAYFELHQGKMQAIIEGNSPEAILNLAEAIRIDLGGEVFGILIRMKHLGLLSQKNPLTKNLLNYCQQLTRKSPTVEQRLFQNFKTNDKSSLAAFFNASELYENILLRFFLHLKRAATDESLSPSKFAEIIGADISVVDELIHKWRYDLQAEIKESANV